MRRNCLGLFFIFIAYVGTMVIDLLMRPSGDCITRVWTVALFIVLAVAGLYALIELPLRWSALRRLPVDRRVPGVIGGLGVIAALICYLLVWGRVIPDGMGAPRGIPTSADFVSNSVGR